MSATPGHRRDDGFRFALPILRRKSFEKFRARVDSIGPASSSRMKAMSAPTKKENTDARDGIREGDRGQRARPAARRRDDRDVRGDGQVQRGAGDDRGDDRRRRSEEHTSELQSLM